MVSESGATLLDPAARAALIERVLPRADVVTPNLPEARALSGLGAGASSAELGEALLALGPGAAVVTGGHAEDGADLLVERSGTLPIAGLGTRTAPRTAPAAPTARRWRRSSPAATSSREAARWAREIAAEAVGNGLRELGAGAGPVDVFGLAARAAGGESSAGA